MCILRGEAIYMRCINCKKTLNRFEEVCPYCGELQYDDEPERESSIKIIPEKRERFEFSDEEILALGLYPQDEGYKMSLISQIVGK